MKTIVDSDLSGSDVGNHLRNKERIKLRAVFFVNCIVAGLHFKRIDTADAYAEDHADLILIDRIQVHTAVFYSFARCDQGKLFVEVHFASHFAVDVFRDIEIFYLASKLRLKLFGIKVRDRACAAHAFLHVFPRLSRRVSKGRNGAHTGDYNSI